MKTSYDIIVRPVITEDSMARVPSKCYTFEVAKSATKAEIAKAVAAPQTAYRLTVMKSPFPKTAPSPALIREPLHWI